MSIASRAFETQRRESIFNPPTANDAGANVKPPWQKIRPGEIPPMMFQLRFRCGEMLSYAYSDLRQIRFRDAGHVELGVMGMAKLQITIEGRNLGELAECLGSGLILVDKCSTHESLLVQETMVAACGFQRLSVCDSLAAIGARGVAVFFLLPLPVALIPIAFAILA